MNELTLKLVFHGGGDDAKKLWILLSAVNQIKHEHVVRLKSSL